MQCQTCAFFHGEKSQCRRYAPQPKAEGGTQTAVWPIVVATDWCGEYRSRQAANAA